MSDRTNVDSRQMWILHKCGFYTNVDPIPHLLRTHAQLFILSTVYINCLYYQAQMRILSLIHYPHTHTTVYTTKHKCGSDPSSITHTHTQLFPAVGSKKNFVNMKIKMCLLSLSLSHALSFCHTHILFPAVGSKKSSVDAKIRMCPLSL